MRTTMDLTTLTLPELERARRRLSFDAQEGVSGAAEELATVEVAHTEARREQERAALAEQERRSRAAAAEAAARAEQETEARTRADALAADLRTCASKVDAALATLVTEGQEFERVAQALAATVATLPPPVPTRPPRLALPSAVLWGLNPVLGHHVPRPHLALRKTLSEIIGPALATTPPAETVERPIQEDSQ